MANEILNKVAALEASRRGDKCRVTSLNWGPWEGGMVTPALKAHFEAAGVALIPLKTGAQMLIDELRSDNSSQIEVVLGAAPRQTALISSSTSVSTSFDLRVDKNSHPFDLSIKRFAGN